MNDIIRVVQESLEQIVAIRPIALKDGEDWKFWPDADTIWHGAKMRERAMRLMIEKEGL
jgi:hypothetical protein